ncbi:hypothetical protein CRG49_002130 [Neisseria sp. N95_16]|uniref:Deoxynucleoside monophosphate kinase n=1 Tax=Neisseria brasiliensis TaxID=2666100 RepID=A0A7X2KZ16_9NEIS|nr:MULTISPECIES: hypothetical protein [Neisseria]MRN38584.1 hypothetical protein [Neisseria brasiliensis]PJO10503.1 hypothetical protein CRG49_002130 [Neisseria sp. N95_16]
MKIGVIGLKGSGKDTVSEFIAKDTGFQRTAFAYHIKQVVVQAFGINPDCRETKEVGFEFGEAGLKKLFDSHCRLMISLLQVEGFSTLRYSSCLQVFDFSEFRQVFLEDGCNTVRQEISPRLLMQLYGTEFVRNKISKRFWVSLIKSSRENLILTDVRFPNEVEVCDHLLYIMRDGVGPEDEPHASEVLSATMYKLLKDGASAKELEAFTGVPTAYIMNNGSIEDLEPKAKAFVDMIGVSK